MVRSVVLHFLNVYRDPGTDEGTTEGGVSAPSQMGTPAVESDVISDKTHKKLLSDLTILEIKTQQAVNKFTGNQTSLVPGL